MLWILKGYGDYMKKWIKEFVFTLMLVFGMLLALNYSVNADDQVSMDYSGSSEVNSAQAMPFTFTIPQGLAKADSQIILHINKDAVEPGTNSIEFTDTDTNVVSMAPIDDNGNVVITLGKNVESLAKLEFPLKVSLLIKPSSQVGLSKDKPYIANVTANFVPKDGTAISLNSGDPFKIQINNYAGGGSSGDANFSVVNFGMDSNNPLKLPDDFIDNNGNKYIPDFYAQNGDKYQFIYMGNYMTGYTQVQFPKLAAGETVKKVEINVDTQAPVAPGSVELYDYENKAVSSKYYKIFYNEVGKNGAKKNGLTICFSGWPADKPINGLSVVYAVNISSVTDTLKIKSNATLSTSHDKDINQSGNEADFRFIQNTNGKFVPSLTTKDFTLKINDISDYESFAKNPPAGDFVTKVFDPVHNLPFEQSCFDIKVEKNDSVNALGDHKVRIIYTSPKPDSIKSAVYTTILHVIANKVNVTIIPCDWATKQPIPNVNPHVINNVEPGEKLTVPEIAGYKAVSTEPITVPDNGGKIKVYYEKKSNNSGGGSTPSNGGSTSNTNTPPTTNNGSSGSHSTSSSTSTTQPVSPQPSNPQPSGSLVATKGEAVYALKPIYLYDSKNFNSDKRLAKYVRKPRVNRPMFVVIRYARDSDGRLRYFVRDVNHLSQTDGKAGYITASTSYVRPVYYQSLHRFITVINPNGVNSYRTKKLTGFVKHYRQGTILKLSKIVTHNLTTRYVLTNGKIITANRKLVKSAKTSFPKKITVKKGVKLYSTLNSKSSKRHIKAGKKLQVKKVVYTVPSSLTKSGTKRYQVAGGYVTANSKYVKITK